VATICYAVLRNSFRPILVHCRSIIQNFSKYHKVPDPYGTCLRHYVSTSNMATRRLQPNDVIFSLVLFKACREPAAASIYICSNSDVCQSSHFASRSSHHSMVLELCQWFDAMNARKKESAQFQCQVTAGTRAMREMLDVIKDLAFDGKKTWKPIQAGIQLSTSVALQLSQEVMSTHKLPYFLTGRLSQDPVENLFSQVRGQSVMHPSCSVFRHALRLVTVAQYLQISASSAYEDDGCTYLIDYLKQRAHGVDIDEESLLPALLTASLEVEQGADVSDNREQTGLDVLEGNALYDIMGGQLLRCSRRWTVTSVVLHLLLMNPQMNVTVIILLLEATVA